jgi:hypothetical protein
MRGLKGFLTASMSRYVPLRLEALTSFVGIDEMQMQIFDERSWRGEGQGFCSAAAEEGLTMDDGRKTCDRSRGKWS